VKWQLLRLWDAANKARRFTPRIRLSIIAQALADNDSDTLEQYLEKVGYVDPKGAR
jgi:hypothetical protein